MWTNKKKNKATLCLSSDKQIIRNVIDNKIKKLN
jgi:hypothetical protein